MSLLFPHVRLFCWIDLFTPFAINTSRLQKKIVRSSVAGSDGSAGVLLFGLYPPPFVNEQTPRVCMSGSLNGFKRVSHLAKGIQ